MLPKAINRLTAIPIKIPSTLFRARNSNPKIYMESQKKTNSQSYLEQNEQQRSIKYTPGFKIHNKAVVIKTSMVPA
jgi:hypothetical protein